MSRPLFVFLGVVAAGLAAYAGHNFRAHQEAPAAAPAQINPLVQGAKRPDFSLKDVDGQARSVGEWDGQVLVLNFWATWCPPCRKEMPAFIDLQDEFGGQGLQFVGIAIDDLEDVRKFAAEIGVNYPILVGDQDAIEVSQAYGNGIGALPYTVVIDRGGRIVYTKPGELSREQAHAVVSGLL